MYKDAADQIQYKTIEIIVHMELFLSDRHRQMVDDERSWRCSEPDMSPPGILLF